MPKIIDFPIGLTFHTVPQESKFLKELKKILTRQLSVAIQDVCCDPSETSLPLRFNPTTGTIEYFNGTDWVEATVSNIESLTTGITAFATGGQTSAVPLTTQFNNVTTVATNGDSVKLPTAVAGTSVTVRNSGAANLAVFPFLADTIDGAAANASVTLFPGQERTFTAENATNWVSGTSVIGNNVQNRTATAVNVTATTTGLAIAKGLITSTSAAAVSLTLPLATDLAAQIGAVQGTTVDFFVDNSSGSNVVTIVPNTGITAVTAVITGGATLTVASGAIAQFRIYFISNTTAKIARII